MFKNSLTTKISQLLIFLLLISIMLPVLAFASVVGFKGVVYDGSSVSGSVYSDDTQPGGVTINVYSPDGTPLTDFTADFEKTEGGFNYYSFNQSITDSVYRYLDLKEGVTESVYRAVYDMTAPDWPNDATLSAQNIGTSSLSLNWSQASDNISDTVTYHVYQNDALLGTVTGNVYYDVSGLSSNTSYTFKVEAADALGNLSTNGPSTTVTTGGGGHHHGGGGGGGGYNPPDTSTDGVIEAVNGSVSAETLAKAFENQLNVIIHVTGDSLSLPVSALIEAAKKAGATLTISNANGSITLPLSSLHLDDVAKAINGDADKLTLHVEISKIAGDQADTLLKAAAALGGTAASSAVDYKLNVEAPDGKAFPIESFDTYVKRTLPLSSTIDADRSTVVRYEEGTQKFSFVPSTFSEQDGQWTATAMSKSNSIYMALTFDKRFSDIVNHWAQPYIELLANKLVVDGVTNTTFEPERNITRAEFAALVIRALGLKEDAATASFSDVSSNAWYTGVVGAAAKARIVDGYEDGTFRPDAMISREELAAMVVRAQTYAGKKVELSAAEQNALLAKFADSEQIVWGQNELAVAIQTHIVDGMTDDTLGPRFNATRAQSAAMLKRLLNDVGFIN